MSAIVAEPISAYLPLLVEGRPQAFVGIFTRNPVISDPRAGQIEGWEAVEQFAEESCNWLEQRKARVVSGRVTRDASRSVAECVLVLEGEEDGLVELPVALVGDRHGDRLAQVRVYHSMWPLEGRHQVRPPLLPERTDLALPPVVRRYQDALAAGVLDDVLELFEPDGYAREPAGGEHVHRGRDGLARLYGSLFEVGGIPLEHCTATDDGTCTALEYNVVSWGGRVLEPQAGVACYERGPSGKLVAARIYDDVAVEEEGGDG
jgi:SnoaL-like domain